MAYGSDEDEALVVEAAPGKASENVLADLHGVVAEYLKLKLLTGRATAAEVGAAITFLKNNNITADPATNAALAGLSQTLRERRSRKGGLTAEGMQEAEAAFGQIMGGFPQ